MTKAIKETKAQRVERLKREKNPWEGLDEIRGFARQASLRFRQSGSAPTSAGGAFTPRATALASSADRMAKARRFPISWFAFASRTESSRRSQLRTIAQRHRSYARGIADLTVRQNIQLHWVTIEALPELLEALWSGRSQHSRALAAMSRAMSPDAPSPASTTTNSAMPRRSRSTSSAALAGNAEFYNLPRKFKISITGCRAWCSYPEINDVGLTAMTRTSRWSL